MTLDGGEPIGRFLLSPLLLLLAPPTFDLTESESDWSVFLAEDSGWSDALSAAAVAILALAAALGDGEDASDVSFRKNKIPEGRSFTSSLRVNRPSLGGVVDEEEGSPVAVGAESSPGGE